MEKEYAHLRTKKFEEGFGEEKGLDENGLTPEIVTWLEQAMDAYWRNRIYSVLAQAGKTSSPELLHDWNDVMDDMFGEDAERKEAIITAALLDGTVSQEAKNWLNSI